MARAKFLDRLPVRLAALILFLSAATLVVLTEISRRAVERVLLQQAEIQAALSTAAVADGLEAVMGSAERTARLVARELAGRPLDAAAAGKRARDLLVETPAFQAGTLVLDAAAGAAPVAVEVRRVQTAERFAERDLHAPGEPEWARGWYAEVRERAQPVWSEPYVDPRSGRNAVRVAVPVVRETGEDRAVVGAVAITLELEWLRRLANLQEFSDTSFTVVFSRTGRIILHPKQNFAIAETIDTLAEKTNVPELLAIRRNILARRQGALRFEEPLNARRVHVNYKPVRAGGWGLIVGFDEAEFLKTQRAYRRISFGALGALLVLLTGIVIVVVHVALRPLGHLALAAGEISRRNLECEVAIPRREDEVGRLARAFAAMRDALQEQHLERRWAAQSIEQQLHYHRLIFASMRELVFVLTKTFRISRVNPVVLRRTGHEEANLIQAPLARIVQLAGGGDPATVLAPALKEERELDALPVIVTHRDGGELSMLLSLVPIRDSGRVVGAVVTLRDNTPNASAR